MHRKIGIYKEYILFNKSIQKGRKEKEGGRESHSSWDGAAQQKERERESYTR